MTEGFSLSDLLKGIAESLDSMSDEIAACGDFVDKIVVR